MRVSEIVAQCGWAVGGGDAAVWQRYRRRTADSGGRRDGCHRD